VDPSLRTVPDLEVVPNPGMLVAPVRVEEKKIILAMLHVDGVGRQAIMQRYVETSNESLVTRLSPARVPNPMEEKMLGNRFQVL
jgi:hypothetical protein